MPLPDGYVLRHPELSDVAATQAVMDAAERYDTGEARGHVDDLATEWRDPECRIDRDWWVVCAAGGEVVAVGWVWPETAAEVTADHYVRPDHRGIGLAAAVLDCIEARARELAAAARPPGSALVVWCEDSDAVRRRELDARGFIPARQYFEMAIDLAGEPPAAPWPEGIEARRLRPGVDERGVWEASLEAFAEHHLFTPRPFEEWSHYRLESPAADASLWWLAWAGDELAGYVIPEPADRDAVIANLAVRPPYRGRGLGRALLAAAFATLRDHGFARVRLEVDAQNVTGAVRVYEAAGMTVERRFDVLEKALG